MRRSDATLRCQEDENAEIVACTYVRCLRFRASVLRASVCLAVVGHVFESFVWKSTTFRNSRMIGPKLLLAN